MAPVLITGGHGGIGFEAAKHLASQGVSLVLAGRSESRMRPAAAQLRALGVQVNTVQLDTSSLESVRDAASACRSLGIDSLDAVLCNAGARVEQVAYSPDGYELTFATNYLGHFLLVELIAPLMADQGRFIFTTSGTHDPDTMDGRLVGKAMDPDAVALAHDGKDGRKPSSAGKRYSTSKLCNLMHAYELDRRLRASSSSLVSIAFDPGSIPGTGLARDLPPFVQRIARSPLMDWVSRRVGVTQGSLEFSGLSLARLATDASFVSASGRYYQSDNGTLLEKRSSTVSYDTERAAKLWGTLLTAAHANARRRWDRRHSLGTD